MKFQAATIKQFTGTRLDNQQDLQQLHEADLIMRLCNADESALEQLYHEYYPRLFRFIARITRRDELIDEIINDVMFLVWEKASSYDQTSKASTWVFGIAFNKARQYARDHSHEEEESIEEIDEDNSWLGKQDTAILQLETDEWLSLAMSQLTPEHRAVIELTYYQGLHYGEIAAIMDCPENTVKTRMFHAKKNLALLLNSTNESSRYLN